MELVSGTWIELLIRIGVVVWLALCAIWDTRTGQIPNVLTLPALVLGGMLAGLSGWERFGFCGTVLVVVCAVYFKGFMGGADAKMLVALAGLWPLGLMTVIVGSFLWVVGRRMTGRKGNFRAGVPMALAAAGALLVDSLFYFS
jgi:Flp pilus assembly protein protease CpaA